MKFLESECILGVLHTTGYRELLQSFSPNSVLISY